MTHETFHYKNLQEVEKRAEQLGVRIPLSANIQSLFSGLEIAAMSGVSGWM